MNNISPIYRKPRLAVGVPFSTNPAVNRGFTVAAIRVLSALKYKSNNLINVSNIYLIFAYNILSYVIKESSNKCV